MIDSKIQEVAVALGRFYLDKCNGDYNKAADELYKLHIVSIAITEDDSIVITLARVGLFIGKRGTNIDAVSKFFGRTIKVVEAMDSIYDYIIPQRDYE